jgi:hypothetical protein
MEKEVDIITLCKRLIELTKQEMCAWKDTSEKNRYKLSLKNGVIEIYHYPQVQILQHEYYEVSLFDKEQIRYATYKGDFPESEKFKTFRTLYNEVYELLERRRRRKIALLFYELENKEVQK